MKSKEKSIKKKPKKIEEKVKKKRGRKRITFFYEDAKRIIHSEAISSKYEYWKWWELNRPCRIPKRPDICYKKEGFTWKDFLGKSNNNSFPEKRFAYWSYEKAKEFAFTLGFTTKTEWLRYAISGKKPKHIPSRPDVVYRKNLEWISWKEFLGYDLNKKHQKLVSSKKIILYIIKQPNKPNNVFKIATIIGSDKLMEMQNKNLIRIVKLFYLNDINDDWRRDISHHTLDYFVGEDNEYAIDNISQLINDLSYKYSYVLDAF